MANGTLKVQNIETSSGSGTITLGQSGETIALGSGVTNDSNKPYIYVQRSTNDTVSADTNTLIKFDEKIIDTDNAFDTTATESKFTVPSGKAGFYKIHARLFFSSNVVNTMQNGRLKIYVNGSVDAQSFYGATTLTSDTGCLHAPAIEINYIKQLSVGDYVQAYGQWGVRTGSPRFGGEVDSLPQTYLIINRIG